MAIFLVTLLVACVPSGTAPGGTVPFPHPGDIKEGAVHGAQALELGAGACDSCHSQSGSAARPCTSCHDNYPHSEGWLAGEVHGAGLTGEAGAVAREPCMVCHAAADLVAGTDRSCQSCHAAYPHVEGWKNAGQHGAFVIARGSATAACGACHGGSLEGAGEAQACSDCHPSYPHPTGWAAADQHAVAWALPESTCFSCHGEAGAGGASSVACSQCHLAMPHPAEWAAAHIPAAVVSGERVCANCHDPGFGIPAAMPAACADRCHGGAP